VLKVQYNIIDIMKHVNQLLELRAITVTDKELAEKVCEVIKTKQKDNRVLMSKFYNKYRIVLLK